MPLINHINQSSQIFRPNENRWDVKATFEFVDANTLEPVTSYDEGDYVTVKYDIAPRGVPALTRGYNYYNNTEYTSVYVLLKFAGSGQASASTNITDYNNTINSSNELTFKGYLEFGQLILDETTEGPQTMSIDIYTYDVTPSNSLSKIDLNSEIDTRSVTINDTSVFPIQPPASWTYSGTYTAARSYNSNTTAHIFQTNYRSMRVQHLLSADKLSNKMGLSSGSVVKGFGFQWGTQYAPAPDPFRPNYGTQIWIFHADRENFGVKYTDDYVYRYSYPTLEAAPISGESKHLIFGWSSTEREILTTAGPNPNFGFGYYDNQINTSLCSTSFTWNGTNAICIEACIYPKTLSYQIQYIPQQEDYDFYVTNPYTGNTAFYKYNYCTSYIAGSTSSSYCSTVPTNYHQYIPTFRFLWD